MHRSLSGLKRGLCREQAVAGCRGLGPCWRKNQAASAGLCVCVCQSPLPPPQQCLGSWEFHHPILGISTPLDRRARGSVSQPKAPASLWCVHQSLCTHLHLSSRPFAIPSNLPEGLVFPCFGKKRQLAVLVYFCYQTFWYLLVFL